MRTKDIMDRAQVTRETLRFYEAKGILNKPSRTTAGYRCYQSDTLGRIRFIKNAQRAGFSLLEIKRMLSLKTGPSTTCGNMEKIAREKVCDIEVKIESLRKMKRVLSKFADACRKGRNQQCNVIIQGLTGERCK